jgi:hypothetical protein
MFEPSLILSAVEFESMTGQGTAFALTGVPRRRELARGFYAPVHSQGSRLIGRLDAEYRVHQRVPHQESAICSSPDSS